VNFEKKVAKTGHEAEAALSRPARGIFEETQHLNPSRTRLICGLRLRTLLHSFTPNRLLQRLCSSGSANLGRRKRSYIMTWER
jgi:hypothetical protein